MFLFFLFSFFFLNGICKMDDDYGIELRYTISLGAGGTRITLHQQIPLKEDGGAFADITQQEFCQHFARYASCTTRIFTNLPLTLLFKIDPSVQIYLNRSVIGDAESKVGGARFQRAGPDCDAHSYRIYASTLIIWM